MILNAKQRYYIKNKDRIKERHKRHYRKDKRGWMLRGSKYRAKKENIPFDLTLEDIPAIPTHCPILGIELETAGDDRDKSPSLDKIIPELGYTKNNIRIVSQRYNRLKNNMTLYEAECIVKDLAEISSNRQDAVS